MRISVIIPTYRRPQFLKKALLGLECQRREPDQVVLGIRTGDQETSDFLSTLEGISALPLETATTGTPGVIASMSAAASKTDGEIVCLLDDDAQPEPDWLEKIEARFAQEPTLGILGGRDLLQDNPERRLAEATTECVGVFKWYGRILGNHHRGSGPYRHCHIVKGCNASVRGPLLREIGFDGRLRGSGAQVHWELALCLDIANAGYSVGYDPAIRVIHHVAPRHDNDLTHRGIFSPEGLSDMVWNEHFIFATRCGRARRLIQLTWAILIGTSAAPGFVHYLRLACHGDSNRTAKLRTAFRAMWEGYTSPETVKHRNPTPSP